MKIALKTVIELFTQHAHQVRFKTSLVNANLKLSTAMQHVHQVLVELMSRNLEFVNAINSLIQMKFVTVLAKLQKNRFGLIAQDGSMCIIH